MKKTFLLILLLVGTLRAEELNWDVVSVGGKTSTANTISPVVEWTFIVRNISDQTREVVEDWRIPGNASANVYLDLGAGIGLCSEPCHPGKGRLKVDPGASVTVIVPNFEMDHVFVGIKEGDKVVKIGTLSEISRAAVVAIQGANAAEWPLVIQSGDAKAERVLQFGGNVKEVASEFGQNKVPSTIMDQEKLEALWKAWKLGKVPKVDFEKQVVTVATWSGSQIDMGRWIDDKGNFFVEGRGGTKDLVEGFTYVIEVYTASGIKSVNGQKWPDPKTKKTNKPAKPDKRKAN